MRAAVKVQHDVVTAGVGDENAVIDEVLVLPVVVDFVGRGDLVLVPRVVRTQIDISVGMYPPGKGHRRTVGGLEVLLEEHTKLEDGKRLRLGRDYHRADVTHWVGRLGSNLQLLRQ